MACWLNYPYFGCAYTRLLKIAITAIYVFINYKMSRFGGISAARNDGDGVTDSHINDVMFVAMSNNQQIHLGIANNPSTMSIGTSKVHVHSDLQVGTSLIKTELGMSLAPNLLQVPWVLA